MSSLTEALRRREDSDLGWGPSVGACPHPQPPEETRETWVPLQALLAQRGEEKRKLRRMRLTAAICLVEAGIELTAILRLSHEDLVLIGTKPDIVRVALVRAKLAVVLSVLKLAEQRRMMA